jgi:F-type H+-transporting ATPase subunit a
MAAGAGPLHQFEIKKFGDIQIGSYDISFTNSSMFMVATVILIAVFMLFGIRRQLMVPGRWQSLVELSFKFIEGLIDDTIGKEGRRYLPAIFTVFMFILVGNLLGMLPYSFTFTSHIIVTFVMAAVVFILVTILAIVKHGMHFFSFFVPPGAPLYMWPLLIPIEIISYLSRPISLSVRLFANMLAGHTLIKVIAGFIPVLGFFGVAPFALVIGLTGLEILIAFLQAYVFAILTCLYINDALNLH